jgi:Tol biopolymer transport system component
MKPERYKQIEDLYHAALGRRPEERLAYLERACDGDEALRGEVESLLGYDERAGQFIERPPAEVAAALFAGEPDIIGQTLGHYQVLSRLGAGGMGEVYLAEDTRLRRRVALKLLPAEYTANRAWLRRFEQEAQAASALNHPNIITIYEIGEVAAQQGRTHFIATEFVEGETLRAWRPDDDKRLPQVLNIAIQIASALDAAHKAGIVHRDIKLENVMVRPDGMVKVLDFGLAKLTTRQTRGPNTADQTLIEAARTRPGLILGTLRYMSPEQARGRAVDARSDIFSLGVVIYELLTGQPLFEGETDADVVAAILHQEPPPLADYLSDVPPGLERIIQKALAKDRELRYQNARDLQADLQALVRESELSARLYQTGLRTRDYPPARSSRALTAGRMAWRYLLPGLPNVLLLAAAAWWLFIRRGNPDETLSPASWQIKEVVNWASTPGEVYSVGAFSPDAKRVAYSSTESGTKNIWVKQTTSDNRVRITNDGFMNDNPIWSPDGEEVAFFSLRGNQAGIWRVPYLGGDPKEVVRLDDASVKLRYWAKSGTIYYELKNNLFAVDLNSGQADRLTDFDSSAQTISAINISPDAARIAYVSVNEDAGSGLWVMPRRGGAGAQVARDASEIRNPIWHADSQRILYSAYVNGTYQIFVAYADGRQPTQITFGERDAFVLDVAADGTKILFGSSKEESDIWGVKIAEAKPEFLVASGINSELWPDVAPDGKLIAFQSIKNLSQGDKLQAGSILTKAASSEGQAAELATNGYLPKWSPDGNQLAFLRSDGETLSLYTVKATGAGEKRIVAEGVAAVENTVLPYNSYQTSYFAWSPDGRELVYGATRTGQRNLWVVAADGTQDTQLTGNEDENLYLYCPLWSADGKRIAYTSKTDRVGADGKLTYSVRVIDRVTRQEKVISQSKTYLRLLGWSQDEKALILASFTGKINTGLPTAIELIQLAVATGEQRPIATLQSAYLYNIHLSPDRRTFAFASHQEGKDNVWLISVNGGAAIQLTANNDSRLYFSSLAWSPDSKAVYFGKQSRYSLLSMITNFN